MMTEQDALTVLRELRNLERLAASVRRQLATLGPEWRAGLPRIEQGVRECRYVLSMEDPLLLQRVAELLAVEIATGGPPSSEPAPERDLPKDTRLH